MTRELSMETGSGKPRVLLFSLRNIFPKDLCRCPHYEFEDIICEIDYTVLLAPALYPYGTRSKLAMRLAYHAPIMLNPGIRRIRTRTNYDIFFTVCAGLASPYDLLMVNAVNHLRDMCKTSVCLVDELWAHQMFKHRHFLRVLAKFDVVLLYYSQTVKPLSEYIGRRCVFLPPGIDAILFCPDPDPPKRVIDVYSMGRRSEITHQRLLRMTEESGLFYLHDSIAGTVAINSKEHRRLLANIAKRSRYFIVNPGKIDRPDERGNQIEASNRYYEGAASGAILLGERPQNEEFEKLFDWPDAVTQLPYGSRDIDAVIRDLDGDPERQDRIRRTSVAQMLTRHDWVYRWETVLKAVNLEPMQGVLSRKERLRKLAEFVLQNRRSDDGVITRQSRFSPNENGSLFPAAK
jgi:Glycosyl transferases group 1